MMLRPRISVRGRDPSPQEPRSASTSRPIGRAHEGTAAHPNLNREHQRFERGLEWQQSFQSASLTADHVACKIVIRNTVEALGKRGLGKSNRSASKKVRHARATLGESSWEKLERILLAPSSLLPAEAETRSSEILLPGVRHPRRGKSAVSPQGGPRPGLAFQKIQFHCRSPALQDNGQLRPYGLVQEVTRTPLRLAGDGAQHRSLGKTGTRGKPS
jgi:hypothetical protein